MSKIDPSRIRGIECRFAICVKNKETDDDVHVVKEQIHLDDGTIVPYLRKILNYKRPYYITKKGFRNHEDKKEWEEIERLNRYESTQTRLVRSMATSMEMPWFRGSQRDLQKSPYIYGADISSTSLLKQSYLDKYGLNTAYTFAGYDTETDVVHYDTKNHILMASISHKTNVYTYVQKRFVAGYTNVEERLRALAAEHLGDLIKRRNLTLHYVFCDTEIEVVQKSIGKAHEIKPDFLGIWNMVFDIRRIQEACARANVKLEDLFSDPSIPASYRYYEFIEGKANRITNANKRMNFKPVHRWNTVIAPASFYIIDQMCGYYQCRQGSPEEPSYGLDALVRKNTKASKLEFEPAKKYQGLAKHQFMQKYHPLEYIIYNQGDVVIMEELDDVTKDMAIQLPLFAGCTDFEKFPSQPKRTIDALHHFVLKRGHVMATTSKEMADEFDDETLGIDGWIVMLPSHMVADNGLKCVLENQNLRTNIRIFVFDLDVSGSYPNGQCVFNMCKQTTSKEPIRIEGISEDLQRMQTINLSAGRTNAVEIVTLICGAPTLEQIVQAYDKMIATM